MTFMQGWEVVLFEYLGGLNTRLAESVIETERDYMRDLGFLA